MQRMDTEKCAKMEPATVRVLLVLDDDGAIATLTHHLITKIQADVTIAATLDDRGDPRRGGKDLVRAFLRRDYRCPFLEGRFGLGVGAGTAVRN